MLSLIRKISFYSNESMLILKTFFLGATTVGHNFTSQQQAGHVSHQSQSRHGSTHQRYYDNQKDNVCLKLKFKIFEYLLNYNCYILFLLDHLFQRIELVICWTSVRVITGIILQITLKGYSISNNTNKQELSKVRKFCKNI